MTAIISARVFRDSELDKSALESRFLIINNVGKRPHRPNKKDSNRNNTIVKKTSRYPDLLVNASYLGITL